MAEIDHEEWRNEIDKDVRDLSGRMAGVETGMKGLANSFDLFRSDFNSHQQTQQERNKPPWGILLGSASLTVVVFSAILTGIMGGYIRDLTRVEGDVSAIQGNRVSWADPVQNSELKSLRKDQDDLRKTVTHYQRDATYGEGAQAEQIKGLQRRVFGFPGHTPDRGHQHSGDSHE
jgi:hypothetical protein